MAPVIEAYQVMRGAAFLRAVTFVAEIVRRSTRPRKGGAPWLETTVVQSAWGSQPQKGQLSAMSQEGHRAVAASILTAA